MLATDYTNSLPVWTYHPVFCVKQQFENDSYVFRQLFHVSFLNQLSQAPCRRWSCPRANITSPMTRPTAEGHIQGLYMDPSDSLKSSHSGSTTFKKFWITTWSTWKKLIQPITRTIKPTKQTCRHKVHCGCVVDGQQLSSMHCFVFYLLISKCFCPDMFPKRRKT